MDTSFDILTFLCFYIFGWYISRKTQCSFFELCCWTSVKVYLAHGSNFKLCVWQRCVYVSVQKLNWWIYHICLKHFIYPTFLKIIYQVKNVILKIFFMLKWTFEHNAERIPYLSSSILDEDIDICIYIIHICIYFIHHRHWESIYFYL